MTRASAGAERLLCTLCAKTYAADQCPTHPHEPLLDPAREDVRQRLYELDVGREAPRFAAWTRPVSEGFAATGLPTGRVGLCMECAKTYDGPSCALHPDEPLLDPTREDVRLELIESDDRRRRVVGVRLMFAAFFIALGLGLGASTLIFDGELAVYLISGALAGSMAVARVLTPPLSPRRFGAWTGEGAAAGDLEANAREELVAPLVRAARKALARARIIAAVTVAGVALGTGAALALDVPWAAGATVGGLAALLLAVVVAAVVDEAKGAATSARRAADAWKDPYA